jgi:DNA-binding MarR family transcriptional regulator
VFVRLHTDNYTGGIRWKVTLAEQPGRPLGRWPRDQLADYPAQVADTRWLSAQEQRTWRAFLAMTTLLTARLERELQRSAGFPHAYYEILVRLSEAPGRVLRMSELADAADSSRSRLSHAVARLEELGWVVRESCATDRRGALARLTEEGFATLAAAAPGHVESVRRHLFDPITAEQAEQLGTICRTVLGALHRDAADGTGCSPDSMLAP